MEVRRKEGESISSLIYRFNRRVQRSGIIQDVKGSRFHERGQSNQKRKQSALHRLEKKREYDRKKKLGLL